MKLGTENKKTMAWALGLGVVAIFAIVYEVVPFFMGPSVTPVSASQPITQLSSRVAPGLHEKNSKKNRTENLDPTLQLKLLAFSEQTKYEGSGRNIFVSQADDPIPTPRGNGAAPGSTPEDHTYTPPPPPPAQPIPLKFFGFASRPGEPKKIFLAKDQDVFIAGEGEIVDRRYKVVHISAASVEIQDLVGSGPPQIIQLTPS
ncbi:MAG TPA: hypothetical protein VIW68_14590 [Candidatus Sulfotelmatobacter sp.]